MTTDDEATRQVRDRPANVSQAVQPAIRRIWLGLLVFTIVLRLPALLHPRAIDDETIYSVIAIEIVEGGKPYVDAIERKPPLLFWTYAFVVALSGKYNWFALHAFAITWTLLTMAALYAVGRRVFDPAVGLTAAFFYSLYQPWATWKNLAFNGEMLMNLPIAWALVLVLGSGRSRGRSELLVAGALLAAAFLLKQPAAIAALPLGIYLLLPSYRQQRGLRLGASIIHATFLSVGFWATLAVVIGVLSYQGILGEAYFWTVTDHDIPHGPGDPTFWIRGGRMTLAFAGACAPLIIGAATTIKGHGSCSAQLWRNQHAEFVALVGLLGVSAIGTAASGRFYPHYYVQLVLPLALLAAPVYADALAGLRAAGPWWFRRRVVIGWLALTGVGFLVAHTVGLSRQRAPADVGRYVREHSDPADRLFVWGQAPGVYLDAQRRPASRYVATFPLTGYIFGSPLSWDPSYDTSDRIVPGAWEKFEEDLQRHPPRFIVDMDAARDVPRYPMARFPIIGRLVEERYELVFRGTEGMVYQRVRDQPGAGGGMAALSSLVW